MEALGEISVEVNAYVWNIRKLGSVAMIIEIKQTFESGDLPPVTSTQITRLSEISNPASAVVAASWGALKRRFAE